MRASLYADALVTYTLCKAGLNVSKPPLAATAVDSIYSRKEHWMLRLHREKYKDQAEHWSGFIFLMSVVGWGVRGI